MSRNVGKQQNYAAQQPRRSEISDRSLVFVSTGRVDSGVFCDRRVANLTNKAAGDTVLPENVVNANNAVWP